jgi:lysophospholipase L1-like esterase
MIIRWGIGVLAALTLVFGTEAYAQERWVATWATAAQLPLLVAPRALEDQTVRQIVRISRGGSELRVRLSNVLGATRLKIDAATIGIRSDGATLAPQSVRALLFNGASSITIPPGAVIVSDAVQLEVKDAQDLAISLYVKDAASPTTRLSNAHQTSYLSAPGDHSASESIEVASTFTSWYWLAGVDVRRAQGRAIVAFGDSITEGVGSTTDQNARWPDLLLGRLIAAGDDHSVVNVGISGNRVINDEMGPNALSRLDRDLLTQRGADVVILLEGINDIGYSGGRTGGGLPTTAFQGDVSADEIITGYRQIASRAHDAGLRILIGTLLPFAGSTHDKPGAEAKRQAVNTFIRSSPDFEAVIDFEKALQDPEHPAQLLAAYDSGDHLHPNGAGYQAMADAIDLQQLTANASVPVAPAALGCGQAAQGSPASR